MMGVDLPKVPKVYEAHRTNLGALRRSPLDWSLLCPGPMIASVNGNPTGGLRLSVDEWPVTPPAYTNTFCPDWPWRLLSSKKCPS